MPDTRPRIQFNEEEICNACTHSESKKKIDWKLRKKEFLDMQPGDVASTSADTELLENWIGFKPRTSVKEGIKKFIDWYTDLYDIKY